jgi:heme/copper-type cytochrome/quinol oxidase subunit 4
MISFFVLSSLLGIVVSILGFCFANDEKHSDWKIFSFITTIIFVTIFSVASTIGAMNTAAQQ